MDTIIKTSVFTILNEFVWDSLTMLIPLQCIRHHTCFNKQVIIWTHNIDCVEIQCISVLPIPLTQTTVLFRTGRQHKYQRGDVLEVSFHPSPTPFNVAKQLFSSSSPLFKLNLVYIGFLFKCRSLMKLWKSHIYGKV